MQKVQARCAAALLLLSFMALPGAALAFETVDTLPWPSLGRFPAYEPDARPPTTLWVQGGLMRDDNILRLESGGQGDWVTRVGAGLRHEQRIIGRQRVVAEARTDYYGFYNNDELDHVGYSLLGSWNWEVGNDIAGTLYGGRDRRLIDISEAQAARRDIVTLTRFGGTAGVLVTPRLRVRGGAGTAWGERSLAGEAETRGYTLSGGAEYVTPLANTLGFDIRSTRGDAPVPEVVAPLGTFVNNDFREREIALVATYSPQPALRSEWRLGRTKRTYTQLQGRDFEGTTYRMAAEWLPGNKTSLGFEAFRQPRSIIDVAPGHVLATGVSFGPSWAATAKLVFSARLLRERREFQGDPNLALGGIMRDEIIYGYRFGVGWEPQRQWQVGAAIDFGERESNFVGRDYDYTAVTLNVAWRY